MEPLGKGLVNDTWLAAAKSGTKYVLQRLNPAVFSAPALVQENLCKVTDHLQAQLDPDTEFKSFLVIRNPKGKSGYIDDNGAWWRILSYIDDTRSLHTISSVDQAKGIGAALGLFHRLVSTLPPSSFADTLPGFHNTPLYLAKYDTLLPAAKKPEAEDCRKFINDHRSTVHLLEHARKNGRVRQQVIHGDPKVANFLFAKDKKQVVSLIDLDTVKPGLLLHDLGDCLRSCCNPLGEEFRQPDNLIVDAQLFMAMLEGYMSNAAELLTPEDRRLLVDSVHLISLELGLRFYSDYLAGNCYFKTSYPEQNLFRARGQFALVRSIENQYSELVSKVQQLEKKGAT